MFLKKILILAFFISNLYASNYKALLVANMNTGQILYQENANELNYPASLTKIMTLYLVFDALKHDRLKLDDYLIVSDKATKASPVKLGLKAGSKITVEDSIKALIVHSANDVARVLAENLKGGKEESFASLMTNVAIDIGLKHTNFENSSGLPNDDQISTARDIALLSIAIYKHFPEYWKYFKIQSWQYNNRQYINGNRLLREYSGCDGMKTGYTQKSKYSLIATATKNNIKLISVVLGAKNKDIRAEISKQMLDKGFAKYNLQKNFKKDNKITKDVSYNNLQCGAFNTQINAKKQSKIIYKLINMMPVIEKNKNNLYCVNIKNLQYNNILKIKKELYNNNIDCFILP